MKLRIAFIHPNLGLGGAERLVVDAAVWLKQAGHSVTILTTYHDPSRCFEPTRDGTLDVSVHGNFLPSQVFNRLRAPCTLARMTALACAIRRRRGDFDVIICDLVAHIIPLVRASLAAKVVFYCHYPDLLLTPDRRALYQIYRQPIDALEAAGMKRADKIVVNSHFTKAAFEASFPHIEPAPEVLYPGVDHDAYQNVAPVSDSERIVLLSVNRFDGAKNLGLAIEMLARLKQLVDAQLFGRLRLILAGGYSNELLEAAATVASLRSLAERLEVLGQVQFVLNPTEEERIRLLADCRCFVYTPAGEHFGLAPLEAMAAGRPVIAVNQGGPLETILDGRTGYLCAPSANAFAQAAVGLISCVETARTIGRGGREHVRKNFSQQRFGERLEAALHRVVLEKEQ